jgi:PAS domain S-box-containing protein
MAILGTERAPQPPLGTVDDHYRLLVDAVTDYAIYMLDPSGRVASWNPGAQRLKGYTASEILGQHFSKFYTPEDRAAGWPEVALATAQEAGRFEKEGWRIRKDGGRFWANVIVDPIRDHSGSLIGFAKITRDITERVAAEAELRQTREALFQAQKMEAIGQLTGGIAHDFNNLLMAILSSLELAKKRLPDDPKLARFIENAVQGANRGASLTQRMLAFARRQTLNAAPVSVPTLVSGIKDLIRRALGPTIEVTIDIARDVDPIMADANQLEVALLNIVVNARDAMPNGGSLFLTARNAEIAEGNDHALTGGRFVCFSVSDTGTGMDEETLERAKEPFFTTKGVGKGTGLGLSQVHGLLEQLGGRLVLRSVPDSGTTAELWLPVAVGTEVPAITAEPELLAETPRGLHILAVDDDALVLMNTAAMLEDMGHKVKEASSAQEAIDILREMSDFDIIITDMAMPQMNGLDFARTVWKDWPKVPILLATGYAELPERPDRKLHILSKPFGQRELAKGIEMVLNEPAG